jgi:hypothetical protein
MEQIEDGNDAAPCPFNSIDIEFEDESKLKIGLRKESTDEEVWGSYQTYRIITNINI